MTIQEFGWPMTPGDGGRNLELRYDRRIDENFLDVICDGPLRSLQEYAREARYPVDLQFRRDIHSGDQRAQLYVGLQRVLSVYWRSGRVRFEGHTKYGRYQRYGFDDAWREWMAADAVAGIVEDLDDYLELVIPKVASVATEGAVQSAITSFQSTNGRANGGRAMLDREFTPQFESSFVEDFVMNDVSATLLAAIQDAPVDRPRPTSFGPRLDVLGTRDGVLQAIEVKPKGVASIVWAPVQVIVYARLVQRWLGEDPEARDILRRLAEQRRRVGLLHDDVYLGSLDEVQPVIAVQRGGRDGSYLSDMMRVIEHLAHKGIGEAAALKVYEVSLSGRMRRLDKPLPLL
ncbi:hypothetical protein [Agromyces aureus]|uniref:Uncharacterized protein n=1 Tax=Agromyces aureus TaxID=453304 RepID=A0A191WIM2_9MICO|nr:hypothetical protein [Agromyces aureus]ANJ28106.1 hypothetical protein ATC03_16695 [Agromyces aureus]